MLQDHCTQDDDDNRIVADSIAKHLSLPASFTNSSLSGSPRSIRQLKVVPSTTPSIRLFLDKWMFGSRHIGWNMANHYLTISSCVRCCE